MKTTFNGMAGTYRDETARILDRWGVDFDRQRDGSLRIEGELNQSGKGPAGTSTRAKVKEIAREVFGDPGAVITLNMAEYQDRHDMYKLVGAPPGYVGFEEGGLLTNEIRKRPNSVVLMDEVDKASPEVMKALSDMLSEGVIRDPRGIAVSMDKTVILQTTDTLTEETRLRRAAEKERAAEEAVRAAEEAVRAVERAVVHATILQSPMAVSKPLSFRK